MYRNTVTGCCEYYEFVGWAKNIDNFLKVVNGEIKSSDVINFIFDEVIKQAELQAKHIHKDLYVSQTYIDFYQQCLEDIANSAMSFAEIFYTKNNMFVFGPMLGGVYVYKKVY